MNSAFDAIAGEYDSDFTASVTGKAQRQIVWDHLKKRLGRTPLHILEVNCGTGTDASHFAAEGHRVLATDVSEKMLHVADEKAKKNHLSEQIEFAVWNLNQPFPFPGKQFDMVFSNFGGLNCLSPDALQKCEAEFGALLRPGGRLIVVVMGRCCIWETLYFLMKGKWKRAFRRRSKTAVKADLGSNSTIDTWYYSPGEMKRIFTTSFICKKIKPVGFFIPPSYLEPWAVKHPRLTKRLIHAEKAVSGISFLSFFSDHYLVEFSKRSSDT